MPRTRHKQFQKIEDLATHDEPNVACEQLAAYWNVEIQTVRKWIRLRWLKGAFRVGRSLRVKTRFAHEFEKRVDLKRAG